MSKLLEDRLLLLPLLVTAVIIAVGSVLVVTLTGDGTGGDSAAAAASVPATAQGGGGRAVRIDIADFKYNPETVTVKAGAKLSWTNNDTAPHTATSDAFDTGDLDKGDSKVLPAPAPGTYDYVCEFHPFMKGKVVVE